MHVIDKILKVKYVFATLRDEMPHYRARKAQDRVPQEHYGSYIDKSQLLGHVMETYSLRAESGQPREC